MTFPRFLKQYAALVIDWLKTRRASFVWRFTLLYTALLITLIAVVFFVLYQLSIGEISRSYQQQIQLITQQQRLFNEQMSEEEYLAQFSDQTQQINNIILAYQNAETTYGHLTSIPNNLLACPAQTAFLVDSISELRFYIGCIEPLANGRLLIAFDDENLYFLRVQFLRAGVLALLLTLALGILSGRYLSTQLLGRIKGINDTAKVIQSGDLAARIHISHRNDEFDLLASYINRMLNQLEDSFHAVSGVTDSIAHDLRTTLGRLRLRLESHLHSINDTPINEEQLQEMLEDLDHILTTFSAMLELSRLEDKQARSQFRHVDLNQVAEDVIDLIQPLAQEKQQTLSLIITPQSFIQGDKTLIFRAMFNTLENACKYTDIGGTIEFITTPTGFIVKDNGPGIADEFKDKVLQRLFRLESSRTSPGYGLGFPLIKAIAQFHKGKLELQDNQPGLQVHVTLCAHRP
ncbi:two-component sensor histidine kinase [Marinomonas pontica]|uniref:histidine kinase n=1 Tax=Marinomonas pontica TaxID=264739 RepID=A0ABN6WI93_9GAMM|nr:two-component sensor histidine kinase [Marinomonas pontica]